MPSTLPARTEILRVAETFVIGAIGGALFLWAHFPGGLISGAMIAVAGAAIAGRPLHVPPLLAQAVLVLLGISLGSLVSRQMISNAGAYPLSIAMLAFATFCATFGSCFYLQRIHGWDRTSAFLAGSPGALSQIIMLASERNANVAGIAVVQTMRVIILTAALPMLLAAVGAAAPSALSTIMVEATPLALAELLAGSVLVAWLLRLMNFPASWMFGAMLASSVMHGAGWIEGGLPNWARAVALTGIGTLIGTRFARMSTRTLLSHIWAALGSFGVAIIISAIFMAILTATTSAKLSNIVVAFAPGAMDAMLALALTLHIDPIFVGAHHLARFLFVTIATPGIVHLFGRPQDTLDD